MGGWKWNLEFLTKYDHLGQNASFPVNEHKSYLPISEMCGDKKVLNDGLVLSC